MPGAPRIRIAIVELDYHHNVLASLCALLDREYDVNVFTTASIRQRMGPLSFDTVTFYLKGEESDEAFVQHHEAMINGAALVILNTVGTTYKLFATKRFSAPVLLRVHNAYKLFDPLNHLFVPKTPFLAWKAFSYGVREVLLMRYFHWRKHLLHNVDYFSFLDETIEKHALEKGFVRRDQLFPVLPIEWHAGPCMHFRTDAMQVTVTGAVDQRRRNYEEVFRALERLTRPGVLQRPVRLCLLGSASSVYGRYLIRRLEKLTGAMFQLRHYNTGVPQEEFAAQLKQTDLYICPSVRDAYYQIYREEYGRTKLSGGLFDLVRCPRLGLVPERLGYSKAWLRGYDSAEGLCQLLLIYNHNPSQLDAENARAAFDVAAAYGPDAFRDAFHRRLTDVINGSSARQPA